MKLDLFSEIASIDESKLHPKFRFLKDKILLEGEKEVLKNWTEGFVDRDNKIIKEFQTTFHSSFWEFYLFALFEKAGFELDQSHNRPDFIIKKPDEFYIEAVVSNIKKNGRTEDKRTIFDQMSMFVPPKKRLNFYEELDESIIRHSNAIVNKNKKITNEYSECAWIHQTNPFLIAMSSYDQINYGREYIYPMLALLYGFYYDLKTESYCKKSHIIKKDTNAEILLGLFNNSEYENISAIIYSCTMTLGKLTSLSLSAGNISSNIVYNLRRDHLDMKNPYKLQFVDNKCPEDLSDGVFIFHNPNAKKKFPLEYFETTNVTQYFIKEDCLKFTSNTYPIMARLNISKELNNIAINKIQENLREYNQKSFEEFYDFSS